MKIIRQITASVVLIAFATSINTKPTQANPVLLLAPELCATGVGCVVVGIVVIGGISYKVWQDTHNHKKYYSPIRDAENPTGGWQPGKEAVTYSVQACHDIARKYGKNVVDVKKKEDRLSGGYYYVCYFDR